MCRVISFVIAALLFLFASSADAMCYTVFKGDELIYQSAQPPVDLSLPLSVTVPAKFGDGAGMLIADGNTLCPDVVQRLTQNLSSAKSSDPKRAALKNPRSKLRTNESRSEADLRSVESSSSELLGNVSSFLKESARTAGHWEAKA